jgi:hypothetical protein
MQSVLDLARLDMNDADKTRNTDANLLSFANDGIAKAVVIRPDLNWGNYSTAWADLTTASSFPLPLEYRPAIANYVVGCAEKADDQFAVEQRAIQAMKLFLGDLGVK